MNVQTIDFEAASAAEDFTQSLHDTGFAVLRRHPVERQVLEQLYRDWSAFFNSREKERFHFTLFPDNAARAGFFPKEVSETAVSHTAKDIKEFFQVVEGGPLPESCAERISEYRQLTFALGLKLLNWLGENTPGAILRSIDKPLSEMISLDASMLRVLHYPPLTGIEEAAAVRAAAHEDINMITVLPISDQPGLQVQDNAGNWIDVSGNSGDIVINSGDMLREATGGFFPSTTHRVLNPGSGIDNVSRISMPHFLTPEFDVRLSDRYTSGSYLEERLALINR